jgi:hypothetical protein
VSDILAKDIGKETKVYGKKSGDSYFRKEALKGSYDS